MTHQFHLARAAVWHSEYERKRRKVAAWHTLWELGQAREALRRMGEVLPTPPRRSREAFADAIYRLADKPETQPFERHLTVLDGGLGDSAPSARGGAAARRDPDGLRMGGKPSVASGDVERQGHPHNLAGEGQGVPDLADGEGAGFSSRRPTSPGVNPSAPNSVTERETCDGGSGL